MNVIETSQLRKVYRTRRGVRVAVSGLDLSVPAGGVHGFLGPNGSGKTTTIRMLLGLARASGGSMALFGQPVPRLLPEVIDRVGAVVESPKFTPQFTARLNLQLLAGARDLPRTRVDEALEVVGLTERANDRFGTFSLGMKQRLAIAATLLKRPELLILDEPTNGLDPAGIHEIRRTVRELGDQGVTVLISSHILAEIQQVADAVTIIGRGQTLASGPVADLLADGGTKYRVRFSGGTQQAALAALGAQHIQAATETSAPGSDSLLVSEVAQPESITRALANADLWVSELTPVRADLEQVYLQLTQGSALAGDLTALTQATQPTHVEGATS